MALTKYRLGDLIALCDERNDDLKYSLNDLKGISIQKIFIETKADMSGVSLKPYKLVRPNHFAYVTVTSRNGEKITLAHNDTNNTYIVSSSYIVFKVKNANILSTDYLFMYFNRPEFDRYSRFNSWGSARETFSWEDFCDIEINLPPIEIQEKYVAVYRAMVANQKSYESGLADLKLTCDAYIDRLKSQYTLQSLDSLISLNEEKNEVLQYTIKDVKGISIEKKFIDTKANMEGVSLRPYAIINPNEFAYVTVTSRNGERISLAHNNSPKAYICSSSYIVFAVKNPTVLLPDYLAMLFRRKEFDRYARFHSWGSARETFDWEEMCQVKISIPPIEIQQSIVNIYKSYLSRKEISERLKDEVRTLCPILIKGSMEEAEKEA